VAGLIMLATDDSARPPVREQFFDRFLRGEPGFQPGTGRYSRAPACPSRAVKSSSCEQRREGNASPAEAGFYCPNLCL
jgi:hypothetical protein